MFLLIILVLNNFKSVMQISIDTLNIFIAYKIVQMLLLNMNHLNTLNLKDIFNCSFAPAQ